MAGMKALGLTPPEVPSPLNLRMNIPVHGDGSITWEKLASKAGDYVVLCTEMDCVVVMSACPQGIIRINANAPTEAHYEVHTHERGGRARWQGCHRDGGGRRHWPRHGERAGRGGRERHRLRHQASDAVRFPMMQVEITDVAAVRSAMAAFERIDIVVNCTGIEISNTLADLDMALFDRIWRVKVGGTVIVTQAALPKLTDGARVINFASELAYLGRAGT
jgi:NAD(P)-dependent dehydrogenase (short-subunit alcohol dehydrogenase family)